MSAASVAAIGCTGGLFERREIRTRRWPVAI